MNICPICGQAGGIDTLFCQQHDAERLAILDNPFVIEERPVTKKDAGWNVEIFKKGETK